jgi:hypothetical protein
LQAQRAAASPSARPNRPMPSSTHIAVAVSRPWPNGSLRALFFVQNS